MKDVWEKRYDQEGKAFFTRKAEIGLRTSFCGVKRPSYPHFTR